MLAPSEPVVVSRPGDEVVEYAGSWLRRLGDGVRAAVEQQRTLLVLLPQCQPPADDDPVVAAVEDVFDPAVDPGEDAVEHRRSGRCRRPADRRELVLAGPAESGT